MHYTHKYCLLQRFIDELVKMPDVWIVNMQEVIHWMREPTPHTQLNSFEPWKCAAQVSVSEEALFKNF